MAQGEGGSGSNVAITAIIVGGLLVAGAGALYYYDGSDSGGGTTVVERNTVIERADPAPAPAPAAAEEPGFSLSHEDEQGKKTEIETN